MSYQVEVTIWCDWENLATGEICEQRFYRERRNEGGLSKSLAAIFAQGQGWDIGGDPLTAYCPDHSRKRKP